MPKRFDYFVNIKSIIIEIIVLLESIKIDHNGLSSQSFFFLLNNWFKNIKISVFSKAYSISKPIGKY